MSPESIYICLISICLRYGVASYKCGYSYFVIYERFWYIRVLDSYCPKSWVSINFLFWWRWIDNIFLCFPYYSSVMWLFEKSCKLLFYRFLNRKQSYSAVISTILALRIFTSSFIELHIDPLFRQSISNYLINHWFYLLVKKVGFIILNLIHIHVYQNHFFQSRNLLD